MSIDSNAGSAFYNTDFSKSFNQVLTTSLAALSGHSCSEVLLINRTGQDVYIYDNNNFGDDNRLLIQDDESMVIRGVSNSASVSAKTSTGTGDLYFRAQMYSNMNQR